MSKSAQYVRFAIDIINCCLVAGQFQAARKVLYSGDRLALRVVIREALAPSGEDGARIYRMWLKMNPCAFEAYPHP